MGAGSGLQCSAQNSSGIKCLGHGGQDPTWTTGPDSPHPVQEVLEEWLNSGCASRLTQLNWPRWTSYRYKASDHSLCLNSWLTTQLCRHRGNPSKVAIWILGMQQKPVLRRKVIVVNISIKKISKKQLKKMNPKRAEERT